jgi:hypothetical protein
MGSARLERRRREQVSDPFVGDPDHPGGTEPATSPAAGGRALRHAGQTTALVDMSVLQRGQ